MTAPPGPGGRGLPVVVVLDRPEGSAALDVAGPLGVEVDLVDLDTVPEAERSAVFERARAVVVDLRQVDAALIGRLSNCGLIAEFGVGVDNIDVDAATRAGIRVVAVPDYCVEELADHTLALILSLTRGIHRFAAATAAGSWDYRSAGRLHRSSATAVGVVGYGRVGRAVEARLSAIGFDTVACDPFQPDATDAAGRPFMALPELLATVDVVTLHCPLTPQSRHLIGAAQLAAMKPSAFLVNTARGGLVDQAALTRALLDRQVAGAALDVLDTEPPNVDLELPRLPNVIVTPHAGFYSEESLRQLHVSVFDEVGRFLRDRPPRNPVNHPAQPGAAAKEIR